MSERTAATLHRQADDAVTKALTPFKPWQEAWALSVEPVAWR